MEQLISLDTVAADIRRSLRPLLYDERGTGFALQIYLSALGRLLQEIDDLVRDTPDGKPGWSVLVDLNRTPDKALEWLAQFVGVEIPVDLPVSERRPYIRSTPNRKRGTVEAMIGAARPLLTGTRTVLVRERFGGAYRITVSTKTSETPNPGLVFDALLAAKAGGLVLTYVNVTGQDYLSLRTNHPDYTDVRSVYTDYSTCRAGDPY